jgi:hypothetical protein
MHTARIVFSFFALSLCAVGCDDSSNNPSADLSADLAVAAADLSASGKTCNQVIMCAATCAGMAACQQACAAQGSMQAMQQYQALFSCAYGVCLQSMDGGAPKCSSSTDTSTGCQGCVTTSAQSAACSTQLTACLSS